MARSAQSQGSVALRAACSKGMEQRWSRTSETNMGCQTAGSGDAANIIWEVERFLHMLHALPDYADFPTASASSQGHDGHLPRVPDVVRWFFDYGVAKFTSSRAITRRPRGCWGWQAAKVSEQARPTRTMLPWPSQKLVPRRRAKSKVCGTGLVQWRCFEVEKSAQPPPPTHPTIGHGIGVTKQGEED